MSSCCSYIPKFWEKNNYCGPFHSVGHNEIIGVCQVGNEAERLGRDHWSEMLSYPRKPIAHWHSLAEVRPLPCAPPCRRTNALQLKCRSHQKCECTRVCDLRWVSLVVLPGTVPWYCQESPRPSLTILGEGGPELECLWPSCQAKPVPSSS